MKDQENYFVRIPHQMPVTVGELDGYATREEITEWAEEQVKGTDLDADEYESNHDDYSFWYDSHGTLAFWTIEEMKEWAKNYKGHQWVKVQTLVESYEG